MKRRAASIGSSCSAAGLCAVPQACLLFLSFDKEDTYIIPSPLTSSFIIFYPSSFLRYGANISLIPATRQASAGNTVEGTSNLTLSSQSLEGDQETREQCQRIAMLENTALKREHILDTKILFAALGVTAKVHHKLYSSNNTESDQMVQQGNAHNPCSIA